MDLPIAVHNIEVKLKSIKKRIQYVLDDHDTLDALDELLDLMDNGTDDALSNVPNRAAGDLSLNEELNYLKSIVLTKE